MSRRMMSIICIFSVLFFVGCSGDAEKTVKNEKVLMVEVDSLKSVDFIDSYKVPGEVKAVNSSYVSPEVGGVIEDIYVKEGDIVSQDKTKLFKIKSESLEKNLKKAKQSLILSKLSVEESQANLERLKAQFDKAEKDYNRHKALYNKKAISESQYDSIVMAYKSADAMLKHGKTLLALAEGNLVQSQLDYSIKEDNLNNAEIEAPIDGKVVAVMHEKGEMGAPGNPLIKIVDTKVVEIKGFIPAKYFNQVKAGETEVVLSTYEKELGRFKIDYKSSVIDPVTRTFEIKCTVDGDEKYLVPGNLIQMDIIFRTKKGQAIKEYAVIKRNGKDSIFTIENNKAKLVNVDKGLEYNGYVEVLNNELKNKKIVMRGQLLLNEGDSVNVREEN